MERSNNVNVESQLERFIPVSEEDVSFTSVSSSSVCPKDLTSSEFLKRFSLRCEAVALQLLSDTSPGPDPSTLNQNEAVQSQCWHLSNCV